MPDIEIQDDRESSNRSLVVITAGLHLGGFWQQLFCDHHPKLGVDLSQSG